ncbi:hypothetical protein BKA62DRAFT_709207 [Auriculariales sp. MPI-PUGE-AT-0066]|nr:hypothetical protein BKA62DRAFT_709207 [Auriculariales sp. MPI-PUGE-AT-0066]
MSMDRFRPNLPLDPFASMEPHFGRAAWALDPEPLQASVSQSKPRQVVLIVGEPSPDALQPTLTSPFLANSLVILATGSNAPLTQLVPDESVTCAVRVVRLDEPLAVQDGGGALFLQVLERAERISKLWRAGLDKGCKVAEMPFAEPATVKGKSRATLRERESNNSLRSSWMTPPSLHSPSPGNSPRSSFILTESAAASPSNSSASLPLSPAKSNGTLRGSLKRAPTGDVHSRPFDALLNILPSPEHTGPKVMLKQAIMVTTLARPFLIQPPQTSGTATPNRQPSQIRPRAGSDSRRWSSLNPASAGSSPSPGTTGSSSGTSSPVTASNGTRPLSSYFPSHQSGNRNSVILQPRVGTSHILHVIPQFAHAGDHAALVRALEAFVLNFADSHGPRAAPMPVVVDDSALGQAVSITDSSEQYSVIDCVLSGGLDPNAVRGRALERRAWLAGSADIQEAGAVEETPKQESAPVPRSHQRAVTTSAVTTKGKQRAPLRASTLGPEGGAQLPSPPPSPPPTKLDGAGTPSVTLTPPSAVHGRNPTATSFKAPFPTSPSPTSSDDHPTTRQLVAAVPSQGSVGQHASRSEPMLHNRARTESAATGEAGKKKSRRWWWPFKGQKQREHERGPSSLTGHD